MNTDWFIRFEEYLHGQMGREEKSVFEAELSSNEEMNAAFQVYRTIEAEMNLEIQQHERRDELSRSLDQLNGKYFSTGSRQSTRVVSLLSRQSVRALLAVAASLLVLLVVYALFFQSSRSPEYLAENYVDTHLRQLSQTMDASQDHLQLGISAYNEGDFDRALEHFQQVLKNAPDNYEAFKNIGLVYLMTGQYEMALQQFDELAEMENLYSNPGKFLKAVTLMRRNEATDKQEAKNLLEQVVREDASGRDQAEEWLKSF